MSKKFNEYDKLNLSEVNRQVLQGWNDEHLFEQSMKVREGAPSFVFYGVPLQPTECLAFIMLSLVLSRILSAATRP